MDPAGPQLGVVDELVGVVAKDAGDLGAHVGEATAVRHVGIGHVDVDRRRDVLDEHLEPGRRSLRLARGPLEARAAAAGGGAGSPAAEDDANAVTATTTSTVVEPVAVAPRIAARPRTPRTMRRRTSRRRERRRARRTVAWARSTPRRYARPPTSTTTEWDQYFVPPSACASRGTVCAGRAARGGAQSGHHHPDPRQARSSARHGGPRDRDPQPRQGVPAVHRRPVGRRGVGETLDVENPATGEVVATVPASSARGRRSGGRTPPRPRSSRGR